MNEQELERHLKEGDSFVYNPDTNEFELAPRRKTNENDIIIELPVSPNDNIGEW